MADTIDVSCPSCDKKLKVPAHVAGKKIKCKGCGAVIAVPAEKPVAAASKPSPPAEESGAKPTAPAPAASDRGKVTWDDEADSDNKPMSVVHEDDNPRCPHCAQLLEPPDAIICIHCGFNNRTRIQVGTKKVFEPEPGEWFSH